MSALAVDALGLLAAASDRIAAALALHAPLGGTSTCGECFADPYPCPTVRLLRPDAITTPTPSGVGPSRKEEDQNDQQ